MTTALDIITDALLEIGAHDLGQNVPAEMSSHGLRMLNRICQRWSVTPAMIPVLTEISVPLNGAASYTIGPTGADVTAARPIRIDRATAVDAASNEYPVNVLSRPEWDGIFNKNVTGGPPTDIWYQASTPGRVYVYPKSAGYTLKLDCQTLLTSFPGLSTTVTLPEGYESALTLTLAIDLCGTYQMQPTPSLMARQAGIVRAIKAVNAEPLLVSIGLEASQDYEIERGY